MLESLYTPSLYQSTSTKAMRVGVILLALSVYMLCFRHFISWVYDVPMVPLRVTEFDKATFFRSCLWAPAWETLGFITLPCLILRSITRSDEVIFWALVLSSIIFGYGHGGAINIMIQGVLGMGFALAYIRNDWCTWSAIATHGGWNFLTIFVFPRL